MRDILSAVSNLPPASIGLILQYPSDSLKFATMVDRLRLTPDEFNAISQIRADQWVQLIQAVHSEPALRRLVAAAPYTPDLRAAVEQPEAKSAMRRTLELLGIIVGSAAGLFAAVVAFIVAIAAFILTIGTAGVTLAAVVVAMLAVVATALPLVGAGAGIIALIVYFLPQNDPRARAIGTAIFGGTGGNPFVDDIALAKRVSKITIRHGAYVDMIQLTWELNDGTFRTGTRRGDLNGRESVIELLADEYITMVTGRSGTLIDSLSIHTSKGRTFGPFGGGGGNPFTLVPDLGDRILGFHGRSGACLDALGVCSPVYGSGMHGGTGGDPFLDAVPPGARISEVLVRHGVFVDSIQVQWIDSAKVVQLGTRHGGEGGERTTVVKLADGEWISRVSGRAGAYLDHLELTTNKGKRYEFGGTGGNPFSIDVEPGEQIVGFFGRAGAYIDAIGVCVNQVVRKPLAFDAWIALQGHYGMYLGSQGAGVGSGHSGICPESLFQIVAVDGQAAGAAVNLGATVALRGKSGKYLSTRAAPALSLDADAIGDAERFTLVHPVSPSSAAGLAAGEVVALRAKSGKFVRASDRLDARVEATTAGADGTWLVPPQPT